MNIKSVVVLVLYLTACSYSQSVSCTSNTVDGAMVTICDSTDGYRSVTRCENGSCRSSTLKQTYATEAEIRQFCKAGIEGRCKELADRIKEMQKERARKLKEYGVEVCTPTELLTSRTGCEEKEARYQADLKLAQAYWRRQEAKKNAKLLELCEKGVYDKPFCDQVKEKVAESQ